MAKDEKQSSILLKGGSDSQLYSASSNSELRNLCGMMTDARISLEKQWTNRKTTRAGNLVAQKSS